MKDLKFEKELTSIELRRWKAFKWLCANFLENKRSPPFKMGVENLLEAYKAMGCRLSLKIHFLLSHRDFFPANLSAIINNQGERFYPDIQAMDARYQDFWNEGMLADYCWMLYRDVPPILANENHIQSIFRCAGGQSLFVYINKSCM